MLFTLGLRNILVGIPSHVLPILQSFRDKLLCPKFLKRHRSRPRDFTRTRQLTFPVVMIFILQKTVRSIQRHLHEFLDELAGGELFEPVTTGAATHARAKLKHTAFIELNQAVLLPGFYQHKEGVLLGRNHRLIGVDSSLLRLPSSDSVAKTFGWKEVTNQAGATGTRYPEGRLSVLYDVLNRVGLDVRLEPSTTGEVPLAIDQLIHLQPADLALNDRGFSGYLYFASVLQRGAHFVGRCSKGSFLEAQQMFRLDRAGQSKVVWLFAPPTHKPECRRLDLPLKIQVRFVSVRLPTGELEVLATSLLDEQAYPTNDFLDLYHCRWGHETFHMMLKGRLDLENFSGLTEESVRQDVHAAVFLSNLESLLAPAAQAALNSDGTEETQPLQINRANSYHALKEQLLKLLYSDMPIEQVLEKLLRMFLGSPVPVRPGRKPPRRLKTSYHRSYHYQRRAKKVVF